MKRYIQPSATTLAFNCPACHNKTLKDVDRKVCREFDIDYHDTFVCDKCAAKFYGEQQYDGTLKFISV